MGEYQLIVIGAGINGAAIAREAALAGIKTLIIERGDIACGTSSASSRLIHGGLRYLEYAEIGLVYESLRERERPRRHDRSRYQIRAATRNRTIDLDDRIGRYAGKRAGTWHVEWHARLFVPL